MESNSAGQRALWTFLMHTLVGPFLAALAIMLLTLGAGALGVGPPSLKTLPPEELLPTAADWALTSYVWSAMPAAVAGAALAILAYMRGTYGWLEAAVAGAVTASIAAFLAGGVAADHITPIAAIAALALIGVRTLLVKGGILA